jgi:hypothetical protein
MLKAHFTSRQGLFDDSWEVASGSGAVVGIVNGTKYRNEVMFESNKRFFRILSDFYASEFQLKFAGMLIATANKQAMPMGLRLTFGGRGWFFNWKREQFLTQRPNRCLVRNGVEQNSILWGPGYPADAMIDLPDDWPLEIQIFLLQLFLR